ncbi:MAG: uncharacterized protein QOF30_1994 [Acidimicrobiaceae bacterium]|jgi:uncharacterized membrane protein (UPF0127 family)|nr:uncharacterized protein [Acidimicrobiaceae bacterium]
MAAVPARPSDHPLRWIIGAAVAILVVALAVFLIRGIDTAARPTIDTNGARLSRVAGFDQIGFSVRRADGSTSRHCGLLALTAAQQAQGLMNRTDLAGYDAMLFQFGDPTTTQFYMKDTLIALSIAWFDASGHFVSATDMTPCGSAAVCPLYHADGPYTVALEVALGRLGSIGAGAGSTIAIGGSC